ncbi:MAG: hypothetical protein WBW94_06025 [Anaerolineales bacterium]
MKRLIVLVLAFGLTACLPASPNQTKIISTPSSTPDILSTAEALAGTLVVETMQSLPTPTIAATVITTFTTSPSSTPTGLTPTAFATQTVTVTGISTQMVTATATSGPISIDKLPPGAVYGKIAVQNSSGKPADISLHCTTVQGYYVVLEFTGVSNLTTKAPTGSYTYVVYVGGKQIIGGFAYNTTSKLTITIYTDHVAIH